MDPNNFQMWQFYMMLNMMNNMYPNMGYNMTNYNMYNNQYLMNLMMNWMKMNPILQMSYQNMMNQNMAILNNNNFNKMNFINSTQINNNQPKVTGGGTSINNLSTSSYVLTSQNDNSPKINVTFTTQKGNRMNIVCPQNMKIKDLFVKYITRLGLGPNVMGDSIFFLFNGKKLSKNDNRELNQLGFGVNIGANIVVIDTKDIIGA